LCCGNHFLISSLSASGGVDAEREGDDSRRQADISCMVVVTLLVCLTLSALLGAVGRDGTTRWCLYHVVCPHDDQHFTPALTYRRRFLRPILSNCGTCVQQTHSNSSLAEAPVIGEILRHFSRHVALVLLIFNSFESSTCTLLSRAMKSLFTAQR